MPYFNGTGPTGAGVGTGRGLGPCGAGLRRGLFGFKRRFGLNRIGLSKKGESQMLKEESEFLEQELETI